jgi:hypothetical protein
MGNLSSNDGSVSGQDMVWNQGMMPMDMGRPSTSSCGSCSMSSPAPAAPPLCCHPERDTGNSIDETRDRMCPSGPEVDGPFRKQRCYTGGCITEF